MIYEPATEPVQYFFGIDFAYHRLIKETYLALHNFTLTIDT